jgi:hypothetical protein
VIAVSFSSDVELDLTKTLAFGGDAQRHAVSDIIEMKYLSNDCKTLQVAMRDEEAGFGSRRAGAQMRTKCLNLLRAEPECALLVDWDGIQMISSSFADEFIGKLFVELGPMSFVSRVRQTRMTGVVRALIDRAILQRTAQEMQDVKADH